MLRTSLFFFILLFSAVSLAQNDSIKYTRDYVFNEGIYITYSDFRMNRPITKNVIESKEDKEQLDFIGKTVENSEYIFFKFGGHVHKVKTDSIWGFSQNNTVFINYDKKMFRVPVFGNISQFVASVEVINNYAGSNSPYYYNYGVTATNMPTKGREVRQFLLDFYSGEIMDYTLANITEILKRDDVIYKSFMALSKGKRKKQMGLFLRNYNNAHPVYFPK
ncbi:MAG: hypothetical protein Q8M29_02750 [Bacteroidota bacterium]|nr:hypothetical protein [Bacteroidota bacterium]